VTAMVIDSSALLAILKVEPEALAFVDCLRQPVAKRIATATLLETRSVVEQQLGEAGQAGLDLITPMALQDLHVHWALAGWRRYGKGRRPAGLNLGGCFSYGLAKALNAPLLFKGADFAATDVAPALPT